MAQELKQTTTQAAVQVQGHRLTQQQMLQVRLLEMPLTELEENVSAEIYDNPALEVGASTRKTTLLPLPILLNPSKSSRSGRKDRTPSTRPWSE